MGKLSFKIHRSLNIKNNKTIHWRFKNITSDQVSLSLNEKLFPVRAQVYLYGS